MARFTGRASDVVSGTVFAVTPDEIQNADKYEVAAVRRVAVVLTIRRTCVGIRRCPVRAFGFVNGSYAIIEQVLRGGGYGWRPEDIVAAADAGTDAGGPGLID
jgi:hypothetical protein